MLLRLKLTILPLNVLYLVLKILFHHISGGVAGRTRTSARPKPLNRMDSVDAVVYGGYTLKRKGSAYECK